MELEVSNLSDYFVSVYNYGNVINEQNLNDWSANSLELYIEEKKVDKYQALYLQIFIGAIGILLISIVIGCWYWNNRKASDDRTALIQN